ncbi:MAG TPA: VWA domain-containing protein [Xanthomonadaceae bacterium]|jgi:Ca-activated chloride channel family protein
MNAWANALPHLLRPWWLLALLALPLLWWLWRRRAHADTPWTRAVDPHLLPSLLQEAPASRRSAATSLFAACYALAVLSLAGPAWRQPVATYTPQAPLVVVEDMSSHMLAADLPPSRLLRARLKIQQLIAQRKGGQIGLVAYAGDAFTVAPISDDAHSLDDLIVALAPDTMPVDGQRADRGLRRAAALLSQAGFTRGTILLLSDGADAAAVQAARELRAKGYEVDAIGIGTTKGAPLPASDGTFAQDDQGGMRIARLDADALRGLADAGGGRYAELTSNDGDLAALDVLDPAATASMRRASDDAIAWRDGGPFLLLALLPLVALGFRRGWLAVALLAMWSLPAPQVEAKETGNWSGLWQRADQRADHALRAGDAAVAGELAQTSAQRAAAAYRKGDYQAADDAWSSLDDADANYNRGNALAQMQRYPQAIDAWQRALKLQPDMADAKANIGIVRQLMQKQKQARQQKPQQQKPQQQKPQQQQQNQQQQQHDQDQQGQSKNQENMQHSQQQAQQQGGQPTPGQQKQSPQQQTQAQPANRQQGASSRQDASQERDASQQPAPDRKQQQQADAAEQQALQQALRERKKGDKAQRTAQVVHESNAQREQREANETLLRRVPDEPGSLLRRKFALEYQRRQQEGEP